MTRTLQLVALALSVALAGLPARATEPRTLFEFGGLAFAEADLSDDLRQQLYDAYAQYYEAVGTIVRNAAFDLHVEEQAKDGGKTAAAVRAELLPAGPIPDKEIEAFYRANQRRIQMPLPQVKDQITEYLSRERERKAKEAVVEALRDAGTLKVTLPLPRAPSVKVASDGFPAKGPADAPVTIVEFADFQCPHCKAASPTVKAMLEKYAGKVRVVYMDFPINRSGISRLVSKGAVCAREQGRFWDYHDRAFAEQATLNAGSPEALARGLSLDMGAFSSCYASTLPEEWVVRAEREAGRLGLSSTPTLFVNGRRLRVTRGLDVDLEAAVQVALKNAGA